jgi:flagellar basal-body rod modification protein FlgD
MTTTTPATSTPSTPATNSGANPALDQLTNNFSTFLTLLTTQLKNQDPTSPMDSNQFTQQLVQFSQVEQQINTNSNLSTLISQGQTQIGAYATSYLGKGVSITNGNASLSSGKATWNYSLDATATANSLTVTNANGQTVYTASGETSSGLHQFTWDGKDNNGNQLDDGTYTLTVKAQTADGSAVTTSVASAGVVSEIDMTSGTPKLLLSGGMEIGLGDIANVANAPAATN